MDYTQLQVWQKAHALTLAVYRETLKWPQEERYGLTSQVRRAAVSIEANLAEGQGRRGSAEFGRFVSLAMGSAAELECELLIARDLHYLDPHDAETLAEAVAEVRRMLMGLAQKLSPVASRLSSPS